MKKIYSGALILCYLITVSATVALAKAYFCESTLKYTSEGVTTTYATYWSAEGSCCGQGSGNAIVDYTRCHNGSCTTTSDYITVAQAQANSGCSTVHPAL
jgi:hypothetical protein